MSVPESRSMLGEVATLTASDRDLLNRILANPIEYPMIFKGWLETWLEPLIKEMISGRVSAALGASGGGLEAGDIIFTGGSVRAGFVAADGASYDGTNVLYADLWAAYGTRYGGTGISSFKVPDIQGRVVVGIGTHADVDALGDNEGQATVASRRPKHRTTNALVLNTPAHAHGSSLWKQVGSGATVNSGGVSPSAVPSNTDAASSGDTLTGSIGTNVSGDPLDTPSFIVLQPMIKL